MKYSQSVLRLTTHTSFRLKLLDINEDTGEVILTATSKGNDPLLHEEYTVLDINESSILDFYISLRIFAPENCRCKFKS